MKYLASLTYRSDDTGAYRLIIHLVSEDGSRMFEVRFGTGAFVHLTSSQLKGSPNWHAADAAASQSLGSLQPLEPIELDEDDVWHLSSHLVRT